MFVILLPLAISVVTEFWSFELERNHLEVKKQEASWGPKTSSRTCKKKITGIVFRDGNKSIKVGLIDLEVLKQI